MKGRTQWVEGARSFKYREARMGIRAGLGAHREEDEGKERMRGPRVTRATVGPPEREWLKAYSKCSII
jgi:hypothetical protein